MFFNCLIKSIYCKIICGVGILFVIFFFLSPKSSIAHVVEAKVTDEKTVPFFSVVMPSYNREKLLPRAIQSVLSQTYQDYEFIILDDGSTDGTNKLLQDYSQKYPQMRVITLAKNKGVANARNVLNQEARGKYIAIMDSDDIVHPDWLEKMFEFISKNKEIELIIPQRAEFYDGDEENKILKHYPLKWIFVGNSFGNVGNVFQKEFVQKHQIKYDETLICGEDYDFWVKFLLKGGSVRSLNEKKALVDIRRHTGNGDDYEKACKSSLLQIRNQFAQAFGLNFSTDVEELVDTLYHLEEQFCKKYPNTFDVNLGTSFEKYYQIKNIDINSVRFKKENTSFVDWLVDLLFNKLSLDFY